MIFLNLINKKVRNNSLSGTASQIENQLLQKISCTSWILTQNFLVLLNELFKMGAKHTLSVGNDRFVAHDRVPHCNNHQLNKICVHPHF